MSLNIFQIWESIGNKTPFAVRRDNWTEDFYTIVEIIENGEAFGYPTVKGQYSSHYEYDTKWRKNKLIPCCGCYQWTKVENADLDTYKKGLKATEKSVKGACTINSIFYFGKYKGSSVEDVFKNNPNYIEWSIKNIKIFYLTPKTILYLEDFNKDFKFQEDTKQMNSEKIAVANNL